MFFKWANPSLFLFISILVKSKFNYKLKKHSCCAWYLDPDRRMVGADTSTELWQSPPMAVYLYFQLDLQFHLVDAALKIMLAQHNFLNAFRSRGGTFRVYHKLSAERASHTKLLWFTQTHTRERERVRKHWFANRLTNWQGTIVYDSTIELQRH